MRMSELHAVSVTMGRATPLPDLSIFGLPWLTKDDRPPCATTHVAIFRDAETFRTHDHSPSVTWAVNKAKEACNGCAHLNPCRKWAHDNAEPAGIWAGETPEDRGAIR